jgi:hypothetical protein
MYDNMIILKGDKEPDHNSAIDVLLSASFAKVIEILED